MRTKTAALCASIVALLWLGAAGAQEHDRAEILALMEQAFLAVGSGDPDDMRALQLAEGTSISFRPDPGGDPGKLLMRMSSNEELVASDSGGDDEFVERWIGEPTVMIRGPIAVVWGEYEFRINGEFSHCGVDAVDLVKTDGNWKIANWMWTVERDGCPAGDASESPAMP